MGYVRWFDDITLDDIAEVGGKGANLGELAHAGLPLPAGFVLTTGAYAAFVESNHLADRIQQLASLPATAGPPAYEQAERQIRELFAQGRLPAAVLSELREAYDQLAGNRGTEPAVAVRSSATAEDLASASFAGQQDTYLNIRGAEALASAARDCWSSLWSSRAMAYRAREGLEPATVSLAVVVQELVDADAAGVMFTANPANGRRNETVVSAAWGLGESVVRGSVASDDVVIDSATGRVLSRRTADKQVMIVRSSEGVREEPVAAERRTKPVLNDEAAAQLADLGARITAHYAAPQDIEWALAGKDFSILQSRPITALPEPSADAPTDWPVPYPHGLYFRASIVEQLPDPLSPLFADLIDGSVTRSLSALLSEGFGSGLLRDGDLAMPTINGYAYYYYRSSAFWRIMLRSVTGIGSLMKGRAHMGLTGWRDHSHPLYLKRVAEWAAKPVRELSGQELLDAVSALLDAGTTYYTSVQSVIPVAASSEIFLASFYKRLVRRPGDPPAQTFLLGYDSEPIRAEKSLYDVAMRVRDQPHLAQVLLATSTAGIGAALADGRPPSGADPEAWQDFSRRFQEHLDRFGHAVYNLDFLSPVAADNPAPLLEAFKFYLRGRGSSPYERQALSATLRDDSAAKILRRLDPLRRAAFKRLLRWAQRAAPIREDALADMGLAWPLMRRMLFELGRRLVRSGVIADPADVFWLRLQELKSAVDFGLAEPVGGPAPPRPQAVVSEASRPVRADAVEERKMLWRGQRRAMAPQMLPEMKRMQRSLARFMPAGFQGQEGDVITGIGASPGQVRAPARVLGGPEDFSRLRPGEVLVARMTTPAWTALFAMASAVVTDVGGPLSHSSIVAREYRIPAVLGTGVATQRIASGRDVRVDGDAGTVEILPPAEDRTRRR